MSFFGANWDLGLSGFEIDRKIIGIDANDKMTTDKNAIIDFYVVDDASLKIKSGPMSRAKLQTLFGGDIGIENLMAIVYPTTELRIKKGLKGLE
jgi:hypothetical protein